MIKDLKVKVILIVKKNQLLSNLDISKYNSQYNNLIVKYSNDFHDRYIIIDNKTFYHCGASINKIGNKTFSINILEDDMVKEFLLCEINKVK